MNERFSHIPVQDPLNKPSPGIILLQRPNSQPQPPPEEPNPNFPPAEQQLDETILAAINNQRDRSWVLQLECDLEQFLRDPKVTRLDLPQIGSYQRLVVHRVAQYFNLDHAVIGPQGAKRAISLFKNPQSALPPIRLASLVPQHRELVPVQIQQPPAQAKSVKILPRIAKPEPAPVVEPKQPTPTKKPSKVSNKTLEQREEDYAKARARIFSDSEPALTQIAPNPGSTPPSTPTNLSDPDLSNPTNTSESPSSTPSSIRSSSPIEPQQNNSERESSDHSLKEKEKPQNFPASSISDNKEPRESNPKKRGSKKKPQSYKDPNASHVNSYAYSRQRGNVNPNKPINNSYSRGGPKTFARGDRMHSYSDPNVPLYNSHPWTDPTMIPAPWPRDNRTVPVVPYSNAPNFYYTGTFQKPIYQPSYNPHAPYMPVPSSGEMNYPQANLNQYHMNAFPPSFSPHGYPQPTIEEQFQRMDLHGAPMEKFGFAPGNVEAPAEPMALDPNCTVEIRFHTTAPVSLDDPRFAALRNRGAVIQFLSPSNIWIGVFPSFDATQQAISELPTDIFDVIPLNSICSS